LPGVDFRPVAVVPWGTPERRRDSGSAGGIARIVKRKLLKYIYLPSFGGTVWVIAALAAALSGCAGDPLPEADPLACGDCNVILVTFDALRADRLGVYGYEKNTSPALDAFARQGFVFTRAVSQSGSTASSLPSLLTSRYPFVDKVFESLHMTPGQVTLADVLRGNGYHTAAVIGWQYAGSEMGFDQGFDLFDEDWVENEPAARTRERAIRVMQGLRPPFFLWIHFRPPHFPYEADEDVFAEFYPAAADGPTLQSAGLEEVLEHYAADETPDEFILDGKRGVRLTPSMLEQLRALYDGSIRRADAEFGLLMEHLDANESLKDTVVVVASDHGESLGAHGLFDHNYLLYPILHVPLIVRLPSRGHAMLSHPVMNVDIFPTVLRVLGIQHDRALRGRDLFDEERQDRLQFAEYEDRRTLIDGDYKLFLRQTPEGLLPPQLYNIVTDPGETEDLADSMRDEVHRIILLSNSLESLESGAAPLQGESKTREALRSLGYVQ